MNRVFDRYASWVLIPLAGIVPLLFHFSVFDTFDLPKMLFVYASVLVLASLWFWQESSAGWIFKPTGMKAPILCFLGVALLSCVTSIDPARSFFGAYRTYVYGWLPMVVWFLLFFFTSQIKSEKAAGLVARVAVLSAGLASLYGLLQYTGYEVFDRMPRVVGGRVWSSLGNPIYFGAIALMALPLALNRWKFANFIAVLLIISGLVVSLSRSAWLGSAAAVAVLLFVQRPKMSANRFKIITTLAAVGIFAFLFPQARGRLKDLINIHESSNVGRVEGWKGGMQVWRQHPVLGTGPDTFFEAFRPYRSQKYIASAGNGVTQAHAHNEIIQMAATLGSAGLAAYLWIGVAFIRRLKPFASPAMVASLAGIFIQNQFNPPSVATAAWTAIFAGLVIRQNKPSIPFSKPWPLWTRVSILACMLPSGLWALSIPLRADAFYKAGITKEASHNPAGALVDYRQAVRLRPDIEAYQTSLGNAARSLAYWDEAWIAVHDQLRWHPANPDDWNNLGVAAMWLTQEAHRDHMAEAKIAFEKSTSLDPGFVEAWANLAKWYHIAGNLEKECELWQKVLTMDPTHPMARHVLGS